MKAKTSAATRRAAKGSSRPIKGSGLEGSERKRWSSETERVTINNATEEELDALYGIGPQNARRIVVYRRKHGPIESIEDLIAIDGIGEDLARRIADQVEFA